MALTLRSRTKERIGANQFAVTEEHGTSNSEIVTQLDTLANTAHSDYGGDTAPVCMRVQGTKNYYREDEARVVAYYRTRNWTEWMMDNVNKAIVFTTPANSSQRRVRDLDDRLLEGQSEDVVEDVVQRIDEGENFAVRAKEHIAVRAIVDSKATYIDAFDELKGKINNTALPDIKTGDSGHLLYQGMNVDPIINDTPLYQVSYNFLHNTLPWNAQCLVTEYARTQKAFPSYAWYDSDGNLITQNFFYKWLRLRTGENFYARLFEEADFSLINTMAGGAASGGGGGGGVF